MILADKGFCKKIDQLLHLLVSVFSFQRNMSVLKLFLTNAYLFLQVYQNHPYRHKGCAGLDEEACSQKTISVASSEVHHGREPNNRHEDVVENYQRALSEEYEEFFGRDRDFLLLQGWVNHVHRADIVEEVGDANNKCKVFLAHKWLPSKILINCKNGNNRQSDKAIRIAKPRVSTIRLSKERHAVTSFWTDIP